LKTLEWNPPPAIECDFFAAVQCLLVCPPDRRPEDRPLQALIVTFTAEIIHSPANESGSAKPRRWLHSPLGSFYSLINLRIDRCLVPCILSGESQHVNASQCDCFATDGSYSDSYTKRLFFDFRDLAGFARVPKSIEVGKYASIAELTNNFFISESWENVWQIQS
jgi:hypothetical protein